MGPHRASTEAALAKPYPRAGGAEGVTETATLKVEKPKVGASAGAGGKR